MKEDFQAIRERVRNGEHLKANIIKLYKWRNVLRPIQPWEADAAGQRQNYMAVREKQELIKACQTEIDNRRGAFRKTVLTTIFSLLLMAAAAVLGDYLYDRYFAPDKQTKPPIIQNIKKPMTNESATSTTDKQNRSQPKTK